jgi:hypothetical protein
VKTESELGDYVENRANAMFEEDMRLPVSPWNMDPCAVFGMMKYRVLKALPDTPERTSLFKKLAHEVPGMVLLPAITAYYRYKQPEPAQ